MFGLRFKARGRCMILRLLFISFIGLSAAHAGEGAEFTIIQNADLVCRTPGYVVHVNKNEERMWLAEPKADFGHEPKITKFINTGKKSLFIKAEAQFYDDKVDLLFTLRDVTVQGEVIKTGLRATLRILDQSGEESGILRFKCQSI